MYPTLFTKTRQDFFNPFLMIRKCFVLDFIKVLCLKSIWTSYGIMMELLRTLDTYKIHIYNKQPS